MTELIEASRGSGSDSSPLNWASRQCRTKTAGKSAAHILLDQRLTKYRTYVVIEMVDGR